MFKTKMTKGSDEKLTMEDHYEIARNIHMIQSCLTRIWETFEGKRVGKVYSRKLAKVSNYLLEAKSGFDDKMFIDHPNNAKTTIYYDRSGKDGIFLKNEI